MPFTAHPLRRVVSAGTPRIAAADAPDSFENPPEYAVFADGFHHIDAACGFKPAHAGQ